MHFIFLLMCVKFDGNLILHLCYGNFLKVCKNKEKMNKANNFLKAFISGMADVINFKSGKHSPLI